MNTQNALKFIAVGALLAGAGGIFAQHSATGNGSGHGHATAASPYAGQQVREIKALSAAQTKDLLAGKGMELAKAAELNGYPGPMHTLELTPQLELSPAQQRATQELLDSHKADARRIGAELVAAERALDQAFSTRQIDVAGLQSHTDRIAQLQAALRTSHLQTHLQQTALLTPLQISRYADLRGYTGATGSATPSSPSIHKH